MNVLMLGWEFPPYMSGGLGTACYGLAKALSALGTRITFILPSAVRAEGPGDVRLVSSPRGSGRAAASAFLARALEGVRFRTTKVELYPYGRPTAAMTPVGLIGTATAPAALAGGAAGGAAFSGARAGVGPGPDTYGGDFDARLRLYVESVAGIACEETFDVIHAHDWMTYQAAEVAARCSGKPLVVHVHSTEFDRSGEWVNQRVYDIEREGMHAADRVIAVSDRTRRVCIERYGVAPEKVAVVHNAVDHDNGRPLPQRADHDEKVVLFLGRITMQKGPEYFLMAARKVLEKVPNVKFIMAGAGDLMSQTIELAARLGIGHRVLFTGFLRGEEVDRAYRMADLYVMPSVSEPFGIAPLEAIASGVPVLISRQSGVCEVIRHALTVDFWDVNEMANKMIGVLRHAPLRETLRECGSREVSRLSWLDAARRCVEIYCETAAARASRLLRAAREPRDSGPLVAAV